MLLKDLRPLSKLLTRTTGLEEPRFPVIHAHNHLGESFGMGWIDRPLGDVPAALDEAGVAGCVDLDGSWGEDVFDLHFNRPSPVDDRFRVFGGVDWAKWPELGDGLDEGIHLEGYRLSYRFFETDDEYFNNNASEIPIQDRRHVRGLCLPEDVLRKFY
jgi:hypothetical protein